MAAGRTVAFHTLGCKVNQYDSEAMLGLFLQAGYREVSLEEGADVVVVNTCTVTAEADRKCRQILRQAAQRNPEAVLVAAGCYAQRAGEALRRDWGVDLVLGNRDRNRVVTLVEEIMDGGAGGSAVAPLQGADFEPLRIHRPGEHTRANIKIQEGCDRYCTYCIIPYVRGPIRSRLVEDTVAEVAELAGQGIHEFVLTGIHIASYGRDWPQGGDGRWLLELLRRLDALPGVERLRLGSVEPGLLAPSFVKGLREIAGLCPHFHVSLQSGCDATLRRMGRRYTAAQYREGLDRLREAFPLCACTTDVIVGFPGETEEEFAASLAFVEEMAFARIHVFPYSRREGTRAAAFPGQLTRQVKRERAAAMLGLGQRLQAAYCARWEGRAASVLLEEERDGAWEGYTPEYIRVRVRGGYARGQSVRVRLAPAENGQEAMTGLPEEE